MLFGVLEKDMKYNLDHVRGIGFSIAKCREMVECLNDLRPELQKILDLELKVGNRVLDASRDWPDPGSVFITLREPFHRRYDVKDPVRYNEPNDPHYWQADYSCGNPCHVLAC
jgi:hypothetical protein